MKKKVLSIIVCVIMALSLFACGGSQQEKEKPAKKYMKQMQYAYDTGELQQETETKFDENGREIYKKMISYNSGAGGMETAEDEYTVVWTEDGTTATGTAENGMKITITYDEEGNPLEKITNSGISKTEEVYTYASGRLETQKSVTYVGSEVYSEMEYTFDKYENVIKISISYPMAATTMTIEYQYTYDKKGNIQTLKILNNEGEIQHLTYVYDEKGHLDRVLEADKLYQDVTCDADGNIIESKTYAEEILNAHTIYEYFSEKEQ